MMGGRQRPLVGRPRARRRSALQHGNHARGGLFRQDGADPGAGVDHLRRLLRHRAPSRARSRSTCTTCAAATARCARRRASSPSSAPARPARAAARPSPIPARNAPARAASTEERSLSVNIPAGIEDGTRIRLASEGEAGLRGGPAGDLYIFLSVKPHEFFQRDGADLYCSVPISMTTAALGGTFEVATLDGTQDARHGAGRHADRQAVPPEGQGHAGAALSRRSATSTSRSRSRRRKKLTKRQRELLEEFEKLSSKDNSPEIDRLLCPHEGLLRIVRRKLKSPCRQALRRLALARFAGINEPGQTGTCDGWRVRIPQGSGQEIRRRDPLLQGLDDQAQGSRLDQSRRVRLAGRARGRRGGCCASPRRR